ncbi:unnamed protein product [Schistocephalus solidus]|uniref:Uncharacterized protein n=1 Tax=Schistocephalus solidus TaxID=70667 RepID=A0A183SGK3_SCHSO|nr:unnamed protein product [Schistocephalus solidus]
MVNGVYHMEAGGAWHISGILPEKAPMNTVDQPPPPPQPQQQQRLQHSTTKVDTFLGDVGVGGGTKGSLADGGRVPDSLPLLSEPQPVLPPNLRESERMKFVERWINSIPSETQLWAQTSLNRIVPITDPRSFPDELSVSDTQPTTTGENSRSNCALSKMYAFLSHDSLVLMPSRCQAFASRPTVASTDHQKRIQRLPPPDAKLLATVVVPFAYLLFVTSGPQRRFCCFFSTGYDYYLQATSACVPAPNCSRTSPQRPALPNNTYNASPGVNSRATASSNNLGFTTTSVGLLGPRQPGGGALTPSSPSGGLGGGGVGGGGGGTQHQQQNRCSRMNPGHVTANNGGGGGGCGSGTNNQNDRSKEILENGNHHPHHLAPEHSALVRGGGGGPSNRFFDDLETQVVVKLFSDYFTSGSCPSLSEVRHRIANSVLQIHRNATSIRAKVKRLQTSGRWTDYAML